MKRTPILIALAAIGLVFSTVGAYGQSNASLAGTTWELSSTYYRFVDATRYEFCLFHDGNVIDAGTYTVDGPVVRFTSTGLKTSWSAKLSGNTLIRETGETYTKSDVKQVKPKIVQGKLNIFDYVGKIIDPTSDERKQTVALENDDLKILLKTDLVYEMIDKKTGTSTKGKHGFTMTIDGSSPPKVYLLEADPAKLSTKQFVDDDSAIDKSSLVLIPVAIDNATVSYQYEKPADLKGKTVVFKYSVVK